MVLVETLGALRLADVLSSCLAAVRGEDNPVGLTPVQRAAVLVVDGLGASNLRDRAGHARFLTQSWSTRRLSADSGFPSTTASALTTLTTGVQPGEHGIVGYTVRDPGSLVIVNHLKTWKPEVDPTTWQRSETLFEQASKDQIPSLALGEHRFQGSDFTAATWRGAHFVGTGSLQEQGEKMREFFDTHERALVYLYWPALDRTGHSSGASSDAWIHRLEEVDAEIQRLSSLLGPKEGLVVTSDHGMLDVFSDQKLFIEEGSPLLEGVVGWAGEPRAPQLYYDNPRACDEGEKRWQEELGARARVLTKAQLIAENWLGQVHPVVMDRLGDLIIACLEEVAIYRTSFSSVASMAMLGQHGSMTAVEREVPIIPLGAWA
jgi:hypothetical protein